MNKVIGVAAAVWLMLGCANNIDIDGAAEVVSPTPIQLQLVGDWDVPSKIGISQACLRWNVALKHGCRTIGEVTDAANSHVIKVYRGFDNVASVSGEEIMYKWHVAVTSTGEQQIIISPAVRNSLDVERVVMHAMSELLGLANNHPCAVTSKNPVSVKCWTGLSGYDLQVCTNNNKC